jgi:hypothetical protein
MDKDTDGTARLEFPRGAAGLTIRGGRITDLFEVRFDGTVPSVRTEERRVLVTYPRFGPRSWAAPRGRRRGHVTLNRDLDWEIRVAGGVAHLDADLHDVRVRGIDLGRGASRIDLWLGDPVGVVPLIVRGGASHVTVRRPADAPVRLRVGHGVSNVRLDEQEFGAVGGVLRLESPGAADADDRYEVGVSGGASHLSIGTGQSSGPRPRHRKEEP